MTTTIQISDEVKHKLERMKLFARESYNEILERMIEDELDLNEQTKKEVEEARKRILDGKGISHEQVMKKFGIH